MRIVGGIILALIALYLFACLGLYLLQRSLIFFPQPRRGLDDTLFTMQLDDAQLNLTARRLATSRAVLYFGGNAEDVSASLAPLAGAFPGHALYLLHYRGYGGSSGTPSEAAIFADALVVFDQLRGAHPDITVIGRSLGSGPALRLASVRPVARLVLVTPYDSIAELAAQQFPWFPVRWLLRDKFDSWRYAPAVKAPTTLVLAERDEVIPAARSDALFPHFASGVARTIVIPGAGHNTISEHPDYLRALQDSGH